MTGRALALAATAHVHPQCDVAPLGIQGRRHGDIARVFVGTKAMNHDDGRVFLTRLVALGQVQDGR